MQIAIQSPGLQSLQSFGNGQASGRTNVDNHARSGSSGPSGPSEPSNRGERLIARLDRDNDARLSPGELQGTRLGQKMSVDRFSRLDSNGDGLLEAGEFDRKKAPHQKEPGQVEQVEQALIAKFADLLAEKLPPADPGADIAKALLARLDADSSGALNSEEIAGTRLAEAIGSDFYELDSDKNGALDKAELSAFITDQYLGSAQEGGATDEGDEGDHEGDERDEGDDRDEGDESDERDEGTNDAPPTPAATGPVAAEAAVVAGLPANNPVEDAVQPVVTGSEAPQTVETTSFTSSQAAYQAAYSDQVRASLEAALAFLQKGSEQNQSALDVVRTLYAQANGTLGSGGTR